MLKPTSPFHSRSYRYLFSAQVLSLAGTGVSTVALALLAASLAGDDAGMVLGIALSLKMVVYVFAAPVLASLASRFPRSTWLISLDLFRALLVLLLPAVSTVWQLYVLVVLINLCAASFTPVFQSTIPAILDDEERYRRAQSNAQLAYSAEQLVSPLLAAVLLTVISFDVLFVINALTFLLSAALIVVAALPLMRGSPNQRTIGVALFGIRAYLRTPRLQATFAMYAAVAAGSAMVIVNSVVYVLEELRLSESHLALALCASGAGTMIGAVATPRLLAHITHRTLMLGGVTLLWLALTAGMLKPDWYGLLSVWFAIGAGLGLTQTPVGSLIRMSCRDHHSEAFFAANFSLSHLCWFFAYLGAGWLGKEMGLIAAFAVASCLSFGSLIAVWVLFPDPDPIYIRHRHPAVTHRHSSEHDDEHAPLSDTEEHQHAGVVHTHRYVIDEHHPEWAARS